LVDRARTRLRTATGRRAGLGKDRMVMTVDFLKALSNAYRLTARVGGRQRRGTASEINNNNSNA
jgi:hypothetical protein